MYLFQNKNKGSGRDLHLTILWHSIATRTWSLLLSSPTPFSLNQSYTLFSFLLSYTVPFLSSHTSVYLFLSIFPISLAFCLHNIVSFSMKQLLRQIIHSNTCDVYSKQVCQVGLEQKCKTIHFLFFFFLSHFQRLTSFHVNSSAAFMKDVGRKKDRKRNISYVGGENII